MVVSCKSAGFQQHKDSSCLRKRANHARTLLRKLSYAPLLQYKTMPNYDLDGAVYGWRGSERQMTTKLAAPPKLKAMDGAANLIVEEKGLLVLFPKDGEMDVALRMRFNVNEQCVMS